MTNYDKIAKLLEAGKIAEVQLNDGRYILFSSITSNGQIRSSYPMETLELCYEDLGRYAMDKDTNAFINLEIISIKEYDKAPYIYKAGDMVSISEHIKDSPDYDNWNKSCKSIIGGPFEIKKRTMNGDYEVYTKNKMLTSYISGEYLSPYIEPIGPSDEEIAKAIELLEKAGKLIAGKILDI